MATKGMLALCILMRSGPSKAADPCPIGPSAIHNSHYGLLSDTAGIGANTLPATRYSVPVGCRAYSCAKRAPVRVFIHANVLRPRSPELSHFRQCHTRAREGQTGGLRSNSTCRCYSAWGPWWPCVTHGPLDRPRIHRAMASAVRWAFEFTIGNAGGCCFPTRPRPRR